MAQQTMIATWTKSRMNDFARESLNRAWTAIEAGVGVELPSFGARRVRVLVELGLLEQDRRVQRFHLTETAIEILENV